MSRKPSNSHQAVALALAAAYRLDAAHRELAAARSCFAEAAVGIKRARYLAPDWEANRGALAAARAFHRLPGVVGTSLGHRVRDGLVHHDERVVTVFVVKKASSMRVVKAKHRVPRVVPGAPRSSLPTDVVEVGVFQHAALPGDAVSPDNGEDIATIACFATDEAQRPVALTAMHLITDAGMTPGPGIVFSSRGAGGEGMLGRFLRGTLVDADAAAILLEAGVSHENVIPGVAAIRGARPLIDPGDRGIAVRMRGAISGRLTGRVENCSAALPKLRLSDAIMVSIPVHRGDSGGVLVDNEGYALGVLKGFFTGGDRLAVFSPMAAVLDALRCTIP